MAASDDASDRRTRAAACDSDTLPGVRTLRLAVVVTLAMLSGSLAACGDSGATSGSGGAGATASTTTATGGASSTDGAGGASTTTGTGGGTFALPPANAGLDYQLGGAYPPPAGVQIVSRDRNAPPAGVGYDICYVNGYQTQPDEEAFWLDDHPDLVLRDGNGDPVIDPDWNEMLLDITTSAKRAALADIVGGWIDGCAASGFDAVEIDNLDTYSRSGGLITEDHAVAFMALLSLRAHGAGLAVAQKNSAEIVGRRAEMGTDFAVAEECNLYDECDVYTGAYADAVLVIEYTESAFATGCASYPELSIVLRDLDLVTPSDPGYVHDGC
jgi:hypothetical protein